MTLSLKEFQQLKAFMARSASDSDAEALTAIRMANRLLAQHSLTWDKIFSRTVTVISELTGEPIAVGQADGDDFESTFEKALSSASGSFRDLLLDIHAKYQRGEALSPRQRQVVENAAERAVERHPGGRWR